MSLSLRKMWKNESFKTIIVIVVIIALVFSFWYGSQLVLNTKIPPALAVVSGSMCIPYDGACDGWTHPFERTLHVGDIIVIQGVDVRDLNTSYPDSDIIVFHNPLNPSELIVHRIIGVTEFNGSLYFRTKGDGNGNVWPSTPQSGLDPWDSGSPPGVSQDFVVGKVVMRIPWLGWAAIKMQELGASNHILIFIVILIIVLLVVVEFCLPYIRRRIAMSRQKGESDFGAPLG